MYVDVGGRKPREHASWPNGMFSRRVVPSYCSIETHAGDHEK
jgi:hypothetical protein